MPAKASGSTTGRIPNSIRWHREQTDLSQADLARRTGIDRWVLNRIERGAFLPTGGQAQKIAKALNVTPADIYSQTALDLIRQAEAAA